MNYLIIILSILTLFISGCDEAKVGEELELEESIQWLGVLDQEPEEPYVNSVYYDSKLRISRIFNGETWDTMSVSGIDAISIDWLGPLNSNPIFGTENKAFYHTVDRVSYIYNASTNEWDTLNISGKDGLALEWLDTLAKAPVEGEIELKKNMAYYDKFLQKSFIYNGSDWQVLSADGVDGLSIIWKGELDEYPEKELNLAFYHKGEKISYIFDGDAWQIIAKDGLIAKDGEIIIWQGDLAEEPLEPLNNWAYYNTATGSSFIYSEEEGKWFTLSRVGADGTAIIWLEETYASHPDRKILNEAYRNSSDGNCYIFNGETWDMLSKGGSNGSKGVDGIDVIWQGTAQKHIDPAELNWAYFNEYDGNSYIYNGTVWDTLLQSGPAGFQINWLGELYGEPTKATHFSVYYNKMDGNSWIYDEHNRWVIFCKGGYNGKDGKNIVWKGASHGAPAGYAQDGWIYYDLRDNTTKVYRSYRWRIIAKDGIDGEDGVVNYVSIRDTVTSGEKLYLHHNFGTSDLIIKGEYLGSDGMFHSSEEPDAGWTPFYDQELNLPLYESTVNLNADNLLKLKDGQLIHYFSTQDGGKYSLVDVNGAMGELKSITSYPINLITAIEKEDGTLLFFYTNSFDTTTRISAVTPAGESIETILGGSEISFPKMVLRKDGSLFMIYRGRDGFGYFKSITEDGTVSEPILFHADNIDTDYALLALDDGRSLIAFPTDEVSMVFVGADNAISSEKSYIAGIGDITKVVKCAQGDDGSIYIQSMDFKSYTKSSAHTHSITKLSDQGDIILSQKIGAKKNRVDFITLPDNRIAVMDIGINYSPYMNPMRIGYPYFKLFNKSFQLECDYKFDEEITFADIEYLDDGRFAYTYLDKFDTGNVKFGTINTTPKNLGLELIRQNSNTAYLENNTGGSVIMRVSARRQ